MEARTAISGSFIEILSSRSLRLSSRPPCSPKKYTAGMDDARPPFMPSSASPQLPNRPIPSTACSLFYITAFSLRCVEEDPCPWLGALAKKRTDRNDSLRARRACESPWNAPALKTAAGGIIPPAGSCCDSIDLDTICGSGGRGTGGGMRSLNRRQLFVRASCRPSDPELGALVEEPTFPETPLRTIYLACK